MLALSPPLDEWIRSAVEAGLPELMARDLGNMFLYYEKVRG